MGSIKISCQQLELRPLFRTNYWKLLYQSINWKEKDDLVQPQPCQTDINTAKIVNAFVFLHVYYEMKIHYSNAKIIAFTLVHITGPYQTIDWEIYFKRTFLPLNRQQFRWPTYNPSERTISWCTFLHLLFYTMFALEQGQDFQASFWSANREEL